MSKFSAHLTNLREDKGWSKTYVAKAIGLKSMQTYANWEYGRTEPDFEMLTKIANLFNVSVDSLLGNKEKASNQELSLDEALDSVMSYDGSPVTDHDRETMKNLWKAYLDSKK